MSRATKIRLLLLLAILLVYGQIVTHEFVDWDDGLLIYHNPNIVHPTWLSLSHHWNPWNDDNAHMYDPLVFTLWWGLAHFARLDTPDVLGATLNPYLFHAANLVVHWCSACVVMEILRRLRIGDWAAAAGALVFAIHPLQTEPVAWATGMKDVLSGLFALLTIWRYVVALDSQGKQRTWNYWLATALFLMALLAKPSTVMVPVIAGIIDRVLYNRPWRAIANWLWPWLVVAAGFVVLTSWVQIVAPDIGGPIWARPLIALYSIAFYLGKLVLPIDLRIDYGHNPKLLLTDPTLHYVLFWAWIFPVAAALLLWRSRNRILITAGLIFVAGVLPVLGFAQFAYEYYTTVADRYVYLSMLGVALAVAWVVDRYKVRWVGAAAAVAIVIFGGLSMVVAAQWMDTDSLYAYSLNGTRAAHFLILGDYQNDLAKPYFRRAKAALAQRNLVQEHENEEEGIAYVRRAIEDYQTAIKMEPLGTDGYDRLAKILVYYNWIPQAIAVVKQWKLVDPQADPDSQEPPGQLDGMLGMLYLKNGQLPEAIDSLKRSLAEAPGTDYQDVLDKVEALQAQAASRPTTRAIFPSPGTPEGRRGG
jgi:hypothetical protein